LLDKRALEHFTSNFALKRYQVRQVLPVKTSFGRMFEVGGGASFSIPVNSAKLAILLDMFKYMFKHNYNACYQGGISYGKNYNCKG